MLYRLDTPDGPVCDLLGPVLIARYADARKRAIQEAASRRRLVACTRIGQTGHISSAFTAWPDGIVTRG